MIPSFIEQPTAEEIKNFRETTGMGIAEARDAIIKQRLVSYIDNKKFFSLSNYETEQLFKYLILRGV